MVAGHWSSYLGDVIINKAILPARILCRELGRFEQWLVRADELEWAKPKQKDDKRITDKKILLSRNVVSPISCSGTPRLVVVGFFPPLAF
jgi:hypothetical protein